MLLMPDNTIRTVAYKNASGTTAAQDMFVKYSVDSDDVYTLTKTDTYSAGNAGSVTNAKNGTAAFATTKGNPNPAANPEIHSVNSDH